MDQLKSADRLKERRDSLSTREREVAALTYLGYTNPKMAARLEISKSTVKGYVQTVLLKYHLHSKNELRTLLEERDFSDWAPPA